MLIRCLCVYRPRRHEAREWLLQGVICLLIHTVSVYRPRRHEHVNGFYRVSAYFMAKVLFDILPLRFLPTLIYALIVYFMAGISYNSVYIRSWTSTLELIVGYRCMSDIFIYLSSCNNHFVIVTTQIFNQLSLCNHLMYCRMRERERDNSSSSWERWRCALSSSSFWHDVWSPGLICMKISRER